MNELYYSKGKKETRVGKQGTPLLNITANSKNSGGRSNSIRLKFMLFKLYQDANLIYNLHVIRSSPHSAGKAKLSADFVKVAETKDIQPSNMKAFDLEGEEKVCIVNVEGNYYAIGNVCTHLGGPFEIIPHPGWRTNRLTVYNCGHRLAVVINSKCILFLDVFD